ncbi:hypothetical protein TVD_01435 [Thioalkalivibrio versutus]|uniref:Pilus assembly protein PilW n=1 Tax=Thioalkalivibrio versutus TaxID=106634 RepID=A0A0G3G556_9GAMM|nr:PilW family protein [Thioalkalivibrio versutus]AKJ96383.1 hypothetical protein TVD_01435 [Thioalkalivibrio versutus]
MNRSTKPLSFSPFPRFGTVRGLTLVELMIAMVLGILLIGAVISVFVGTSQTYRTQEAMSKVQESGRFAIELLTRDIRQVGFRGACTPSATVESLLNPSGTGYDDAVLEFETGSLRGWHQEAGPHDTNMTGYVNGTDTILIKKASSMDARPNGNTPSNAATVNLNGPSGIARGQLVILSDAESCDIFQNTANDNASTVTRGAAGGPGMNPGNVTPNNNNQLSKSYDQNAEMFRFESRIYYVGASAASPGQQSLRRLDFGLGSPRDQELVTGVEDFRVRYGEDTNNDGRINEFRNAGDVNDWEAVRAVRINIITNSTNTENVVETPQQLAIEGTAWTATDRRLYQVFSSTIGLRNRLD